MITDSLFPLSIILVLCLVSCKSQLKNDTESSSQAGYSLVWADEFSEDGSIDSSKWSYELGDGCPKLCGWGNNELQYYTDKPENVSVEAGHLIIKAIHDPLSKKRPYTSAKLVTKNKGDWTYGRIEVRSKNPSGRGTWPAIWMLPTEKAYGGWPRSGEIDIMEHVGYEKDSIYGTVHTMAYNHTIGTQKSGQLYLSTSESDFHIYSIEWNKEKIDFQIDNETYFTFHNDHNSSNEWPFDQPFYLVLNLAVGGNWGGRKGVDDSIWPQQMEVDYVRVYSKTQ